MADWRDGMQIGKVAATGEEIRRGLSIRLNRKPVARLRALKYMNDIAANATERCMLRIAYGETYYYLENRGRIDSDISLSLRQAHPLERQLFIHPSLMTNDKLALKVISGKAQDGKELAIAIFRLKKSESEALKTSKLLGLKPDALNWEMPVCIAKARSIAAKALGRRNDSESAKTLEAIKKWESLNRETGELMLLMLCGGDLKKKRQADACIRNIGKFFKELRVIGEKNECGLEVTPIVLPNAALAWPMSQKKAHEIYRNSNRRAKLFMDRWGHDYSLECKARAGGAKAGEANASIQMDTMLTQMDMARKKYGKDKGSIKILNRAAECLYRAYIERPLWNCSSLAERNFTMAIAGGIARMKQIDAFIELDECTRKPEFPAAPGKALRLMAANYMANYCAVWGKEMELWGRLMNNSHVRTFLQSGRNNRILRDAQEFVALARKERSLLGCLDEAARKNERNEAFHAERKRMNLKISAELKILAKISPEIAIIIRKAMEKIFGHVNYKQGERPCREVRAAYLQPIQLAESLRGKMGDAEIEMLKDAHFRANLMMFRMVSGSKKVAEAMMEDISPLLHVQTKGFDMEPELKKLVKSGFKGENSNGAVSLDEDGARRVRITYEDHSTQFGYFAVADADDRVSPLVTGKKDHPDVNLYGRKLSFSELFPGEPEPAAPDEIYSKFFMLAGRDRKKFDSVRQRIADADMATAHYLSTYIDRNYNSGVVLMDGERIAKNLPLKLSAKPENTFMEYLMEKYPSFEADLADVREYVRQKIAIRVADRLHARLPGYLRIYAESLADGDGRHSTA